MKKIFLFLLVTFPLFLFGQSKCDFFKFRKVEIEKTNINTTQSDFGPEFVNNELWFSAYTPEEIQKISEGKTKKIYYNLFSVTLDKRGDITGSKKSQLDDISSGYHAGPVSYCANTGELFVTLNNFDNPEIRNKVYRKADINLRIVVVKKEDGTWKLKEELPFNDSTYSVGHPAISQTGDTLFFASNNPKTSLGGSDIYMSVRKEGIWGNPVNLGSNVNSSFDEMFPFFYNGSVLFYSSNKGPNQKADLNLQYVCKNGDSFGEPVMCDQLNSKEDDFGLVINPEGKIGYFASRREGGSGDDDIYKVVFRGEYNLELVVMDRNTKQPVSNPKVKFSDNVPFAFAGMLMKRALSENSTITAITEMEGYMNNSVEISTVGKPFGIIKDTIWIEKVVVQQKFVMQNIYYDFDKWNILPESEVELNKLVKIMKDNPGWKVELGSHTDSRGSDAYNEILSQKRSDSAVAYIVSNGISKDRIIAKGYGESQLVNRCKNDVKCTEEEHRQNRRTEFKILEMN